MGHCPDVALTANLINRHFWQCRDWQAVMPPDRMASAQVPAVRIPRSAIDSNCCHATRTRPCRPHKNMSWETAPTRDARNSGYAVRDSFQLLLDDLQPDRMIGRRDWQRAGIHRRILKRLGQGGARRSGLHGGIAGAARQVERMKRRRAEPVVDVTHPFVAGRGRMDAPATVASYPAASRAGRLRLPCVPTKMDSSNPSSEGCRLSWKPQDDRAGGKRAGRGNQPVLPGERSVAEIGADWPPSMRPAIEISAVSDGEPD
jgi:hypothetical protein